MSDGGAPGAGHILAIDMGTGTAKAAVVARDGRIEGRASRGIGTTFVAGGGAEQDPEEWWDAVTAAGREALAASGVAAERVLAVRCTTQWAVTVAVDDAGRALAPAISWMDTRGGPYVRERVGGPVRVAGYDVRKLTRWLRLTGGAPVRSGIDGLGHILHLKHERPEVYAAAAAFLEPMDYLNLRLTGRAAASCGSIWPYWLTDNRDVEAVAYDPTLVRWAGIDPEKLPELLPLDATVGTLTEDAAERLGLARRTSVLTGLSDAQAATVGAGIVALGQGYFSIGTTSWLSCLVPSKRTDLRHQLATKPSGLRGQRMAVAEQGPAGRCLEFLRERVLAGPGAEPPPFEELEREAAQAPPGSNGLVFTPWLAGVGAPADDALTRSAFLNQSLRSTRADYVRAVMEGVAYNLRWLRRHVERFARTRFEHLAMIGGGALSAVWSQTFADVLDCEVRQVAEPRYANAAGAALAGFAALGEIATGEIPAAVRTAASYRPDPVAARVHDRQFAHFLRFYERNRRLYRSLNR